MAGEQHGFPTEQLAGKEAGFRNRVEVGHGLIQQQDLARGSQDGGERDQLPLAAGEIAPARADQGLVAHGQGRHQLGEANGSGGSHEFCPGSARGKEAEIFQNGPIE